MASRDPNRGRVMVYVQHLLGTGHQRRAAYLAGAMAERGLEVTLVCGGFPVHGLDLGPVEVVQLPPARAEDARYETLLTETGRPPDARWRRERTAALIQALDDAKPDALVIETFPFGRRQFRFELIPLLEAARRRAPRPFIAVSIRDVLEPRSRASRYAETVGWLEAYFDAVLVHGDPQVLPLAVSFPLAAEIDQYVSYTGYVAPPPAPAVAGPAGTGEVLVSAGGGEVGERLLRTALAARERTTLSNAPWRFLVAHGISDSSFRELKAAASRDVTIERNRPDFGALLRRCAVSISAAGYNSVVEVLLANARSVLVPFCDAGEQEQSMRARELARHGLLHAVDGVQLGADALAHAVDAAAAGPRPEGRLDMSGAASSARLVAAAIARPRD